MFFHGAAATILETRRIRLLDRVRLLESMIAWVLELLLVHNVCCRHKPRVVGDVGW